MQTKLIAACALAVASCAANAVVVTGTQILLSKSGLGGMGDYAITAIQEPERVDPTTLWFTASTRGQTTTLRPVTWNVDQEADYYLVGKGDTFTNATIASGRFKPLFTLDHGYSLEVPADGVFYLGVATTQMSWPAEGNVPFGRNAFGWAQIQNGPDGLKLLDSAMAYNGLSGIIIGTNSPVPEPGTWALLLVGLGGVALRDQAGKRRAAALAA